MSERVKVSIPGFIVDGALVIKDPRRAGEWDRQSQWLVLPVVDTHRLIRGSGQDEALASVGHSTEREYSIDKALKELEESSYELRQAVAQARAKGLSWSTIGAQLGISKQAAQQRFTGSDND